jgi:hypothetical protein
MNVTVSFAQIDARDCVTGYDPVGFVDSYWKRFYPKNKEALILKERMEREYLVAVGKVQEDIAAKYAPLWTEELFTKDRMEDYEYDNKLSTEEQQAIRDEFPGNPADYYD